MQMMTRMALTGAVLIALAGCSRNRAPDQLPPIDSGYGQNGEGNTGGGAGGNGVATPGSEADFISRIQSNTVYFDTDRYNIDDADRAVLASQAQWLAQYPNVRVTVEGHADERGTRDYNLALGARRANAAKNYLASLGISPSRIDTISYGKERPEAVGSDEQSYAQNRRAVTVTVQ